EPWHGETHRRGRRGPPLALRQRRPSREVPARRGHAPALARHADLNKHAAADCRAQIALRPHAAEKCRPIFLTTNISGARCNRAPMAAKRFVFPQWTETLKK